jgi:hypothetical protein
MDTQIEVRLNLNRFIAGMLVEEYGIEALEKSKGSLRKEVKSEISRLGLDQKFDILDLV